MVHRPRLNTLSDQATWAKWRSSQKKIFYWEPEIFLSKLAAAGHPQHMFWGISEEVDAAIKANAEMEYHEVVVHRCKWFGKYLRLAEELKDEDETMSSKMRPEM